MVRTMVRTRLGKFGAHKGQRNGAHKGQRNGAHKGAHKALGVNYIFANYHMFNFILCFCFFLIFDFFFCARDGPCQSEASL